MKGRIEVESKLGQGSILAVVLSAEHSPKSVSALSKPSNIRNQAVKVNALSAENTGLLEEECPPNVLVASTILEQLGYVCDIARDGMQGGAKFQPRKYPLIFLDIQMPDKDGVEAVRHMRAHEVLMNQGKTLIIAVIAYASEGVKEKCTEAVIDDQLAKPYLVEGLKKRQISF